jgi:ABC-type polysaccharide/polyol phosphate export permease
MRWSEGPLASVWHQRALLRALVLRELRIRYAGSAVGLVWSVVNPLLQIAILTTVFSFVLQVRLGAGAAAPFPINLAWGLFPWLGVQEGIARATTSLADSGVLIKRMAFPPEIVMVQPILAAAVQELIALALLIAVMPFLGVADAPTTPLCLIPFVVQVALTVGIGWILGVLHVYFRDTAHVVVAALQAWFYLTPIVYSLESAPSALRGFLSLNPMSGIVESFRAFAIGGPVPWGILAWSACAAAVALAAGSVAVSRARPEIADLV